MTEKEIEDLRLSKQYDKLKRKRITKKERIEIYNQYDGRCVYCGTKIDIKNMQVDHIVPLRKGGKDDLDNMICACRSCNHYKSTLDLDDFKEQLLKITERLKRDSATFRIAERYGLIEIKEKEIKFLFEEQVVKL